MVNISSDEEAISTCEQLLQEAERTQQARNTFKFHLKISDGSVHVDIINPHGGSYGKWMHIRSGTIDATHCKQAVEAFLLQQGLKRVLI